MVISFDFRLCVKEKVVQNTIYNICKRLEERSSFSTSPYFLFVLYFFILFVLCFLCLIVFRHMTVMTYNFICYVTISFILFLFIRHHYYFDVCIGQIIWYLCIRMYVNIREVTYVNIKEQFQNYAI